MRVFVCGERTETRDELEKRDRETLKSVGNFRFLCSPVFPLRFDFLHLRFSNLLFVDERGEIRTYRRTELDNVSVPVIVCSVQFCSQPNLRQMFRFGIL